MHADTVLIAILVAIASAALPFGAWLRARKRIRDLEMTLLAQASDTDRYEELRTLLQQVVTQTDDLADQQATLARRLSDRTEPPPAPRVEQSRPATPH